VLAAAAAGYCGDRLGPLPDSMHQAMIAAPEPDGRRPLPVNPPTFHWPAFGAPPYVVELSRSADLANASRRPPVKHTFDRPVQPLAPGRYWWRVTDVNGAAQPVASFEVGAGVASWPIPDWDEVLSRLPQGRPRLLMRPEDLPRLRERGRGEAKPLIEHWAQRAAGRIGAPLPPDEAEAWRLTEPNELGGQVKLEHAARDYASSIASGIDLLCVLYMVTGETKYRDEIKRRGLATAAADVKGITNHRNSDFANETMALGLAWAYDTLYRDWTPVERARIRDALIARLRQAFAYIVPRAERELYDAHAWQHVIKSMTLCALAIHDESPEAREWFEWGFKAHVAFYPWFGGADGGSAEGLGYYRGRNFRPSIAAAVLFEAAVGVSLFDHPWYRNTGYFFLYGAGLGTANSQFGDGNGQRAVSAGDRAAIAMLAGRFADPHLSGYHHDLAKSVPEDARHVDEVDPSIALLWAGPLPPPASLAELPKSRLFADVGVVYMRSALNDPANDIFFEMRSSPYANYVHAHADQNSFNVTAYGERLVIDTGYYNRYGDPHHRGWTKTMQAHNTILVSGTGGQVPVRGRGDFSAYGRITDYETGAGWVRVTGSAPRAYTEREVRRFDRHVLWLQPDTYLIADDLEAAEPQTFDWLLHAKNRMEVSGDVIRIESGVAAGRVQFFFPTGLRFQQTNDFAVPPTGFARDGRSAPQATPQWHLSASTTTPALKQRFITVLQVHRAGGEDALPAVAVENLDDGVSVRLSDGRQGRIHWH
jgi:hypothetical protein